MSKPSEEQPDTREMPTVEAPSKECKCGCGEKVGQKSYYRPGHDARHVSNLVRMWRAGEITSKDVATGYLAHSQKLTTKFYQQVENSPQKNK